MLPGTCRHPVCDFRYLTCGVVVPQAMEDALLIKDLALKKMRIIEVRPEVGFRGCCLLFGADVMAAGCPAPVCAEQQRREQQQQQQQQCQQQQQHQQQRGVGHHEQPWQQERAPARRLGCLVLVSAESSGGGVEPRADGAARRLDLLQAPERVRGLQVGADLQVTGR
eukprot:3760073-Rhodomonas_salina.1